MAERQGIPIKEVHPNQQEKDAMSERSAVEKTEAKDTHSLNMVTKESESHNHNVQIQGAEALSQQAEIAVEMQGSKHTDTSETVPKDRETQEAEAVSEQAEIAFEKTQEAKDTDSSNTVPKDRETQEAEAVSEIVKLKNVSAIVDIENETVLEIELGTSELLTEPDSNVVSIVPESNIVLNVNRVESVSCDANICKEDLTDSENECAPPEVIFP